MGSLKPSVKFLLNNFVLTLIEWWLQIEVPLFCFSEHTFQQYSVVLGRDPTTFEEFEERPSSLKFFNFVLFKFMLVQTDEYFSLKIILLKSCCRLLFVSKSICKSMKNFPSSQDFSELEFFYFVFTFVHQTPTLLRPIQEEAVKVFNFTCFKLFYSSILFIFCHFSNATDYTCLKIYTMEFSKIVM